MRKAVLFALITGWLFTFSSAAQQPTSQQPAQAAAAPAPPASAPTPVSTPSITGPLQAAPPIVIDAGPLGKLDLDGIVSGMGLVQGNAMPGDDSKHAALSNAQLFLQKTDGWWQFYVQAGAYNILSLGSPFLSTEKSITDLWGPVPVAYLKLVPGKNSSVLIGELPALMGVEGTFDFQNMNIERGLLWNQENSINRGVQLNQTFGKVTAQLSWNDGYYSNRYSWLSGALTYTRGAHTLEFVGMGNLGHTKFQTLATPVENNSQMYALEYTYTKGNWIVQPYGQFSNVPTDAAIGIAKGATAEGGALLVSRTIKHGWSVAGRGEYNATTGSNATGAVNLLYGPGSAAWSGTITPTWQRQRFFIRGDASVVRAVDFTPGAAFGSTGADTTQARGVLQIGLLF